MKNLTVIATCWSHVYSDLEKHLLPDSSRINLNFRFMICLTQAQTGTQSCYIKAGYTHRDFSDLKRFFFNLWQNPHIKIKSYLTVLVELLAQIISIESSYVITRAPSQTRRPPGSSWYVSIVCRLENPQKRQRRPPTYKKL